MTGTNFSIQPKSLESLANEGVIWAVEAISYQCRGIRNKLLFETDWTQLEDSKVDKEVWAKYRQELRDLTKQKGFPLDICWPIKPE